MEILGDLMREATTYGRRRAATILRRTAMQSAALLTAGFVAGVLLGLIGGIV